MPVSGMAFNLAKSALKSRDKPHSSITAWVDILTSSSYDDEAYDGIPEVVDSINLQPAVGPTEASRALRKKLKHGDAHQQYRSLVILKALVENCGHKFQTTFADGQLTGCIKQLAVDPHTNPKVRKKLMVVLASWQNQFKTDPSMSLVAGLYKQCKSSMTHDDLLSLGIGVKEEEEKRRKEMEREESRLAALREKQEAKERDRLKREQLDEALRKEKEKIKNKEKPRAKRPPFNFEKEKGEIFTAIANATQASNNLTNAITLTNQDTDKLQSNERVQECLLKAKQARKPIVRYIQLVENEEVIGTLIETNDRIINSIEMYDSLSNPKPPTEDIETPAKPDGQLSKLQEKQRAAVERARRAGENTSSRNRSRDYGGRERSRDAERGVHPDLQDLTFGDLGSDQRGLPPPIRPSSAAANRNDDYRRGSLSDFSDYESSDGSNRGYGNSRRNSAVASGSRSRGQVQRGYVDVSDDEGAHHAGTSGKLVDDEDPFADPFA